MPIHELKHSTKIYKIQCQWLSRTILQVKGSHEYVNKLQYVALLMSSSILKKPMLLFGGSSRDIWQNMENKVQNRIEGRVVLVIIRRSQSRYQKKTKIKLREDDDKKKKAITNASGHTSTSIQ